MISIGTVNGWRIPASQFFNGWFTTIDFLLDSRAGVQKGPLPDVFVHTRVQGQIDGDGGVP